THRHLPSSPTRRSSDLTDPSCYYDAQTQRFYVVVLTLEVVPTSGAFTTVNHLDIAVSTTSNPTGLWKIYKVDVTGDGTHNTAARSEEHTSELQSRVDLV